MHRESGWDRTRVCSGQMSSASGGQCLFIIVVVVGYSTINWRAFITNRTVLLSPIRQIRPSQSIKRALQWSSAILIIAEH